VPPTASSPALSARRQSASTSPPERAGLVAPRGGLAQELLGVGQGLLRCPSPGRALPLCLPLHLAHPSLESRGPTIEYHAGLRRRNALPSRRGRGARPINAARIRRVASARQSTRGESRVVISHGIGPVYESIPCAVARRTPSRALHALTPTVLGSVGSAHPARVDRLSSGAWRRVGPEAQAQGLKRRSAGIAHREPCPRVVRATPKSRVEIGLQHRQDSLGGGRAAIYGASTVRGSCCLRHPYRVTSPGASRPGGPGAKPTPSCGRGSRRSSTSR
jgi:hypothetical protein